MVCECSNCGQKIPENGKKLALCDSCGDIPVKCRDCGETKGFKNFALHQTTLCKECRNRRKRISMKVKAIEKGNPVMKIRKPRKRKEE